MCGVFSPPLPLHARRLTVGPPIIITLIISSIRMQASAPATRLTPACQQLQHTHQTHAPTHTRPAPLKSAPRPRPPGSHTPASSYTTHTKHTHTHTQELSHCLFKHTHTHAHA